MIVASHTPNMTGVLLSGEPDDFRALYESLHKVIGNVDPDIEDGAVLRILGFATMLDTRLWVTVMRRLKNTALMMSIWLFYRLLVLNKI